MPLKVWGAGNYGTPSILCQNKITFKRTWSLSNAVCFKYVKYLTTNTAKVGHVTPSRPPLT